MDHQLPIERIGRTMALPASPKRDAGYARCDGLVPELQRRGVTRTRYAHKYFKDNLLEF